MKLYISLGGTISRGYEKARVTPYMHVMVYHVPRFMEKCGGIKKFTGQDKIDINVFISISVYKLQSCYMWVCYLGVQWI